MQSVVLPIFSTQASGSPFAQRTLVISGSSGRTFSESAAQADSNNRLDMARKLPCVLGVFIDYVFDRGRAHLAEVFVAREHQAVLF